MVDGQSVGSDVMNYDKAIATLNNNYRGNENSLTYSLYELCDFNREQFWDIYDSILFLAHEFCGKEKSMDIAVKISFIYQRILKEIIYHFDHNDASYIENLPRNYTEYIERIEGAIDAFFQEIFTDENMYSLQQ